MTRKRFCRLFVLTIFLWLSSFPFSFALAASDSNLLQNGGFEDIKANVPVKWGNEGYETEADVSLFTIESTGHDGDHSISIENVKPNDSRWSQKVTVEPSKTYKLSGWIKASGISSDKIGANLSVMGSTAPSKDLKDSNDQWEYVELYGQTDANQTEVQVTLRLGFYGNEVTGKAWFDDVKFEKVDTLPDGVSPVAFGIADVGSGDSQNNDVQAQPNASETSNPLPTGMYSRSVIWITSIVYALIGLLVILFARSLAQANEAKLNPLTASSDGFDRLLLYGGFTFAILVRIIIASVSQSYGTDMGTFQAWSMHAFGDGLAKFYQEGMFADYPPGYVYAMWFIGFLMKLFGTDYGTTASIFITKIPPMICDLLIGWFIYRQTKISLGNTIAAAIALLYWLNPAVLVNSAAWGQVDAAFTIFIVLFIVRLTQRNLPISGLFLAISVLIKPQALIFGLVYLLVAGEIIWKERSKSIPTLVRSALLGIGTFIIGILPFVVQKGIIENHSLWAGFKFVWDKYNSTLASYPYGSVNAFNIHSLFENNWVEVTKIVAGLSINTWGWIGVVIAVAYAIFLFVRGGSRPEKVMLVSLLLLLGFFTLGPKMHERYLYPTLAIGLLLLGQRADRRLLWLFLGLTAAHYSNCAYVLGNSFLKVIQIPIDDAFVLFSSFLQLVVYGYGAWLGWDLLIRKSAGVPLFQTTTATKINAKSDQGLTKQDVSTNQSTDENWIPYQWFKSVTISNWTKRDWYLVGALTVVYAIIALYNLGTTSAPENFWRPANAGESVVVDLGTKQTVTSISYYSGLSNGTGKFAIESSDDKTSWVQAGVLETTEGGMYQWKKVATSVTGRYLRVVVQNPNSMLNEVGFVGADGKTILPIVALSDLSTDPTDQGTPNALFDEQNTIHLNSSYYDSMYFDEIYHARTAYEQLHQIEPYESTHPPLGKIFISIGVKIFGMNPFGWRIVGTLFGIFMVPLMYLFGRRLFGTTRYAFLTAFLMTFDFMHFAQTRIATIDVYGVFFILLMYYFMWKYITSYKETPLRAQMISLSLSGLFFGLGSASKWICIYAGAGLAILWLLKQIETILNYKHAIKSVARAGKKLNNAQETWQQVIGQFPSRIGTTAVVTLLTFIVIPVIIYFLSYIPFMEVPGPGHGLKEVVTYQEHMYNYHKNLVADHPFKSTWYQWPIMTRPIWYYGGTPEAGVISSIVSFGNPAIWWPASLAMLFALMYIFVRRNAILILVCIGFLSQYLPWVLVPRLTFIYHFFASVPFIIFALVYVIRWLEQSYPAVRKITIGYGILILALFILFYPVLSGYPITRDFGKEWLDWFDGPVLDWILFS